MKCMKVLYFGSPQEQGELVFKILDIGNTNESIKRDATRIALNHILMLDQEKFSPHLSPNEIGEIFGFERPQQAQDEAMLARMHIVHRNTSG
jgi:hypothetical protein